METPTNVVRSPIDRVSLWQSRVQWLTQQKLSIAVTLAYNDPSAGVSRVQHDLRAIHTYIDRKLLGSNFNARSVVQRTRFFAFLEKFDCHPHVHIALSFPMGRSVDEGVTHLLEIWHRLAPRGSADVAMINSDDGWMRYITKNVGPNSDWLCSDVWASERSLRAA